VKGYQAMVQEAIQHQRTLWVRYKSGTHRNAVRAIRPKQWLDKFRSKVLLDDMHPDEGEEHWNVDKTYYITRIIEANWNRFQ
jgi:hypothetical protein